MKRLIAFFFLLVLASPARAEPDFPALTGRVVDEAEILSDEVEQVLTDLLEAHELETSNQVVVVTLSSLQGYSIEDYGVQLGRHWGIGQADKDNGVLLIVAPNDREVRIEVGYGLEGTLTDATAKLIIEREIIPQFKAGDLEGGVMLGTQAILSAIGGTYTPSQDSAQPDYNFENDGVWVVWLVLGFHAVTWSFVFWLIRRSKAKGGAGGSRSTWRTTSSWSGSRSSSSSGSSGGGFSGGGGSFGGGGASGRW